MLIKFCAIFLIIRQAVKFCALSYAYTLNTTYEYYLPIKTLIFIGEKKFHNSDRLILGKTLVHK